MTLLNIICQTQAVHVISDAGLFDLSGKVLALGSKGQRFVRFPAVMFAMGMCVPEVHISPKLQDIIGLEDLLARLPSVAAEHHAMSAAENAGLPASARAFWLCVAAYSNRRRRTEVWGISDHAGKPPFGTDYKPFTVVPLPIFMASPGNFDWQRCMPHPVANQADLDRVNVAEVAPRLVDVQRRLVCPEMRTRVVAGFAELFSVDSTGVRVQRLREWPEDRVGGLVDPCCA